MHPILSRLNTRSEVRMKRLAVLEENIGDLMRMMLLEAIARRWGIKSCGYQAVLLTRTRLPREPRRSPASRRLSRRLGLARSLRRTERRSGRFRDLPQSRNLSWAPGPSSLLGTKAR
jgi:hypothetical protein